MVLPKLAFFQGRIVRFSDAKISVMTHALHYGTAAFGGIRAYWNEEDQQLYLFRPHDHYKRFLDSANILCCQLKYSINDLVQITIDLLKGEETKEDVYIRPLVYKADEAIGVKLHDLTDELTIFAVPFSKYIDVDGGCHVTFSSWRRVDDNVIPARGKISAAYANSAFIKTDALRAGFDEALVLNKDGHVSEGTAMNVFMVRDMSIITPTITEDILEGITRRTIATLVKNEMGIDLIERPIDRTEVYIADELFFAGTAAQIVPITMIDHRKVGNGLTGQITHKLSRIYEDVVRGKIEQYKEWNVPVY